MSVRGALQEAGRVLFPLACAACGAYGATVCADCAALIRPEPVARQLTSGLVVHSALVWDTTTAALLHALKQHGRTDVARALAPALRIAVRSALPADPVAVCAVPSSAAAFRRRGFRPVELLAKRAGVPLTAMLRPARTVADQRGLDRFQRSENMLGAFTVTGRRPNLTRVVLIDDVVTTGATLEAACAALRAAGVMVIGAATAVHTPRVTSK